MKKRIHNAGGMSFFSFVGRRRRDALQGDRSGEGGGEIIQKSRSDFEWQDKACYTLPNTA